MIDGLNRLLEGYGQPCLAELRELLESLDLGQARSCRLLGQELLQTPGQRVFRLRFACNGVPRSLIAKRLPPAMARRNELVIERWLPAIGLAGSCASLLGKAAARDGSCAWHLYEDLGSWDLDVERPDSARVGAAVALIALIHTRFAGHGLLGEIRLHGFDFGIHFYQANVQDALCALEALSPPAERRELCARLLDRLDRLRKQLPARAEKLAEFGGPETLLHGDLWAINVFVSRSRGDCKARLIDWDRAGVGPASYDLSTFLLRFPQQRRTWVLQLYEQEVARAGWTLPGKHELNVLFETAELARYANCLIWPAIELGRAQVPWAYAQLAEVEQWFERLAPVIPDQGGAGLRQPLLN